MVDLAKLADGRNRSKWNLDAPPFFPSSSPRSAVSASLSSRESTAQTSSDSGIGSVMSYSAALKSTKPRPKPVVQAIEPPDDKEGTSAESFRTQPQPPPPQQPAASRKNKPSKSIPLGDFLFLKLNEQQKPKSEDQIPVTYVGRSAPKPRAPPQKEAQKSEKHPPSAAAVPRGNILDSSVPVLHKGKQRENPKKKYTRMKKAILSERNQRKEDESQKEETATEDGDAGKATENGDISSKGKDTASDTVVSAVPNLPRTRRGGLRNMTRFRDNILSEELDKSVTAVISELGRFQDRLYAKDPDKARMKKRLVYGLREVHKLLKVEKIKCVILAPNIESASGDGGLDNMITDILTMCRQHNVPYFFALTKMKLGYVSHKHSPVSCAGILNYDGANELYKTMLECVSRAKEAFVESPQISEATTDILSEATASEE